jgi:hypothetical protein
MGLLNKLTGAADKKVLTGGLLGSAIIVDLKLTGRPSRPGMAWSNGLASALWRFLSMAWDQAIANSKVSSRPHGSSSPRPRSAFTITLDRARRLRLTTIHKRLIPPGVDA